MTAAISTADIQLCKGRKPVQLTMWASPRKSYKEGGFG